MKTKITPENFDQYIADLPENVQRMMVEIRAVIKKAAPDAVEKISYSMPAFTQKGMLIYIAAHKNHIGFYPFISAIEAFKEELEPYHTSKGTVRFPLDKPLPLDLISKIVKFRVKENLEKSKKKSK